MQTNIETITITMNSNERANLISAISTSIDVMKNTGDIKDVPPLESFLAYLINIT